MKYSDIQDKEYGIHIIQEEREQHSFFVETKIDILINQEKIFSDLKINKSFEEMDGKELKEKYEKYKPIVSKDHKSTKYPKSKNSFIFTLKELQYLKKQEKRFKIKILKENYVDGSKVIELYNKLIESAKSILHKKIIEAEFSSILYKFIFQVTANIDSSTLESIGLEKIGFFYVIPEDKVGNDENDIYSLKNGFNFGFFKKLDNTNFQFCVI
ncbi:MAG TPA: hypothetical protein HA348_00540 [Thermoplasmata archaeon]|nr:hypothetical protein [Thermoplasmata archaeon]